MAISIYRRQLTLFVSEENDIIESIRARFNPEQHKLISAHVTLCREDEIAHMNSVIENIKSVRLAKPLCIRLGKIRRTHDGSGVYLPSDGENEEFNKLRKSVLKGLIEQPRHHEPHITLMHPRNATCTDELFEQLTHYKLPAKLYFNKISLIEEKNAGKWHVLDEFTISESYEC